MLSKYEDKISLDSKGLKNVFIRILHLKQEAWCGKHDLKMSWTKTSTQMIVQMESRRLEIVHAPKVGFKNVFIIILDLKQDTWFGKPWS